MAQPVLFNETPRRDSQFPVDHEITEDQHLANREPLTLKELLLSLDTPRPPKHVRLPRRPGSGRECGR
jgi:hypothetical protein